MKPRYTPRPAAVFLISGAVVFTSVLGWPAWTWYLLPAVVAGVLLMDTLGWNGRVRQPAEGGPGDEGAQEAPLDPPFQDAVLSEVPVRSALAEYRFLFSATVRWRPTHGFTPASHGNPAGLAVTSVLRRVEECTLAEHPSRSDFLTHWLEGVLGLPLVDESGLVTSFATDVRLTLRLEDQRHLDEDEELRRFTHTWERHREHERNRRAYLAGDVLRSPGSAVVWWLARHEEEVDRAVEMIGPLACLSAAANDQEIPEPFRHLAEPAEALVRSEPSGGFDHPQPFDEPMPSQGPDTRRADVRGNPVSTLLDEMGFPQGSEERAAFVHRLARTSEAMGRPDAAEALRRDLKDERDDLRPTAEDSAEPRPQERPDPRSEEQTGQEPAADTTGVWPDEAAGTVPAWWRLDGGEAPPRTDVPLQRGYDGATLTDPGEDSWQ